MIVILYWRTNNSMSNSDTAKQAQVYYLEGLENAPGTSAESVMGRALVGDVLSVLGVAVRNVKPLRPPTGLLPALSHSVNASGIRIASIISRQDTNLPIVLSSFAQIQQFPVSYVIDVEGFLQSVNLERAEISLLVPVDFPGATPTVVDARPASREPVIVRFLGNFYQEVLRNDIATQKLIVTSITIQNVEVFNDGAKKVNFILFFFFRFIFSVC